MDFIAQLANSYSQTFTLQGVTRSDPERNHFFIGILTDQWPGAFHALASHFAVRRFSEKAYGTAAGRVIPKPTDLPLAGKYAAWFPPSPSMMSILVRSFYDHKNPEMVCSVSQEGSCEYQTLTIAELAALFEDRLIILFTGAGLSMAAGLPNLSELTATITAMFGPVEAYVHDLIHETMTERLEQVKRYRSLFTASEPTEAHWYVAKLCQRYGCPLLTGNLEGLHEKTGLHPTFYDGQGRLESWPLSLYDFLLTIGVDSGLGELVSQYRQANPTGRILAINPEPPSYLSVQDGYISGEASSVLGELLELLA
ncbi:MAG: hypothetical protein FJY97_03230 [candidate division Zixibacteria bacterium]|nr:hypothetical protein [candidate division Zixibacteria bacterium]